MPNTVEEFREQVPLTTYGDYLPELTEKKEEVLPAKVAHWVRTSGRSGEYKAKWVPVSEDFAREYEKVCGGFLLLAFCDRRGDVSKIREHMKVLYTMGPPVYGSGFAGYVAQQALGFDLLPSNSEGLSFHERIRTGFREALYEGLDTFGGLSSVLIGVGEQFNQQSHSMDIKFLIRHPQALLRLSKGLLKSKLARRPMLPRDLWHVKGIIGAGTDSAVFRKRVTELWGRVPLDVYAGTEGGVYSVQTWDYDSMTFVPNLDFFEFIPEREWYKWQIDRSYQPKTVLLDEVRSGENYEVVITNLHGGVLTRFRLGDMVKITSLRNERLGIDLPQMLFERRADDLIDIGLMRLTERVIWQAIENSGIPYVDWTARKEIVEDKPVMHLYVEVKEGYVASEMTMATSIYQQLKALDDGFIHGDLESIERYIDYRPIRVTVLAPGAFSSYVAKRQAEGADLGGLKPSHINPSDTVLSLLGAPTVEVAPMSTIETERAVSR
jgi:hypothetical protein